MIMFGEAAMAVDSSFYTHTVGEMNARMGLVVASSLGLGRAHANEFRDYSMPSARLIADAELASLLRAGADHVATRVLAEFLASAASRRLPSPSRR